MIVPTVSGVSKGEDAERRAFRRRLGITLSRVRTKLTGYASQQAIADELGVDVETVGRWERGDREPKTFDLHRLAMKYDVPGDWLLFPTDSVTELDDRIRALADQRLVSAAAAAAHASLEVVEEELPSAATQRAGRRERRPA